MDVAIVVAVILARLLVPLLIIRWPLPGILACLVLDAADQTIFQVVVPHADLSGYQSYDKALDTYYLAIAYLSTLRNWTSPFAVSIARFLFYYRLMGVVLFEATQIRELLLVFPNTFEYFFIFYEAVRVRWDPRRMSDRLLIGAAAFIWIVIKLPQEWWIHVAGLDTTDFIKEQILGVSSDASWADAIANRPWVLAIGGLLIVLIAIATWWVFANVLPPADRPITFDADAEDEREVLPSRLMAVRERMARTLLDRQLLEKVVLVSVVSIIFTQILDVNTDPASLAVGLAVIVTANTAISHLLARRGRTIVSIAGQFLSMLLLDTAIWGLLAVLAGFLDLRIAVERAWFFLLLMSLLIALYDRYRPEYVARFADEP